jgi:hypothetical protein
MLLLAVFVVVLASATQAKVWTTVYRCDEKTPLAAIDPNYPSVYREVMVGTHLVMVVSSDTAEYWSGKLRMSLEDAEDAILDGRGYVAVPLNYPDSCLEAAGETARVWSFYNMTGRGFYLRTTNVMPTLNGRLTTAGDWFILDYYAKQVGLCDVSLFAGTGPSEILLETLSFAHVPSRDFNGDGIVDFADFAQFSSQWRSIPAPHSNSPGASVDLNLDGQIDLNDLVLFSEYWLERTGCEAVDPNSPADGL